MGPDGKVYFAWRDSDKSVIDLIDPNWDTTIKIPRGTMILKHKAGVTDEIAYSTAIDVVIARSKFDC